MTITIAGKQLATRRPKDLDAALIATTGCDAAENLRIISGQPLPGRIAAAVAPFLPEDAPPASELATMIEQDLAGDRSTLVADAKKLFASVEPAPKSEVA